MVAYAAVPLTDVDGRLLGLLQTDWPLVPAPYAEFGRTLDLAEDVVLDRVRALQADGVLRQIGPIFDTKSLGYASSLVAMQVAPARLDAAAVVLNGHPGVSHNYAREHAFNLWFTIAVPPDSALGLERTVDLLHTLAGAESTRLLPTLRLFKIGVKLDLAGEGGGPAEDAPAYTDARQQADLPPLTARDQHLVRVAQQPWPVDARPADAMAAEAGVSTAELLDWLGTMKAQGRMRRFAAVLRHRKAGFTANGMGVWVVPPERVAEVGEEMARYSAVSHCYQRPTYADWPYALFTMVHGKSRDEVEGVLDDMARECGLSEWGVLFSTTEYKKVRLRYFLPDLAAWEQTHGAPA